MLIHPRLSFEHLEMFGPVARRPCEKPRRDAHQVRHEEETRGRQTFFARRRNGAVV